MKQCLAATITYTPVDQVVAANDLVPFVQAVDLRQANGGPRGMSGHIQ